MLLILRRWSIEASGRELFFSSGSLDASFCVFGYVSLVLLIKTPSRKAMYHIFIRELASPTASPRKSIQTSVPHVLVWQFIVAVFHQILALP